MGGGGNSVGPTLVLPELEKATMDWDNVNDITYTMGTTVFKDNAYTGCTIEDGCTTNTYTLEQRSGKARMITMQEALALGCSGQERSCPIWMYNYLSNSTEYGGTVDDKTGGDYKNQAYWFMSAYINEKNSAASIVNYLGQSGAG